MSIVGLAGIEPGDLFTTNGRDVWRVQSMCERPTITLVNVETGEARGGAVGSSNVGDFVPLVAHPGSDVLPHASGVQLPAADQPERSTE